MKVPTAARQPSSTQGAHAPLHSPPRAKRRPTHAGTATQTRILLAVCALANEAGLGAVSIATVAERAGCAKASVLYHFATREALLVAAVDAALAPWWQAQRAALRGSGDARAALDAWIEAVFGCGEAALRLRAQVDAEPPNQPATVLLSDAERDIEAELAELLARGHHAHCWRVPRGVSTATMLRALADGMLIAALRTGDASALVGARTLCRTAALDLLFRV